MPTALINTTYTLTSPNKMNATFDAATGILTLTTTNVGLTATNSATVLLGNSSVAAAAAPDGNGVEY